MARVKAVLFDYGNVLCSPQLESDVEAMSRVLNIELNHFKTLYWQLRDEYDLGSIDGRAYWHKIGAKCGITLSEESISKVIELDNLGWSRPNPVMANWAADLRKNGIITAIISNMPIEIRRYLDGCKWLPEFDQYTYSCDINSVKPAAEIYLHCLKQIRLDPRDTLFLDDRPMNVDAAKELGISSLVFTTAHKLQSDLTEFRLPPIAMDAVFGNKQERI